MRFRWATSLVLIAGLIVIPLQPAWAEGSVPGRDGFRAELLEFFDGLEGLSGFDEVRIEEAREQVAAMTPDELAALEQALAQFPAWKGVPRLASLLAKARKLVERMADSRARLAELQQGLIERGTEGRVSEAEAEELSAAIADVQQIYDDLNHGELAPLAQALGASGLDVPVTVAAGGCSGGCGVDVGCWVDYVDCLLSELASLGNAIANFVTSAANKLVQIANEIAGLATDVANFFVGLFNSIVNAIDDLVTFIEDNFPTTPNEVATLLGLDDPNWFNNVLASFPILEPPCPQMGLDIPGIGEVGSARAEYVCKRGIDWFAHMLYDLVPDDVVDIPVKLIATGVYYPINYFCMCMESQSAISFSDAQAEHRAFVEGRLDVVLSTRATHDSAQTLLAGLGGLDSDVAVAQSQINLIDVKVEDLQVFQDDQGQFLEAYRDLLVRINIEESLLDNPSRQIALFELPEALGGYLERVRDIVDETIQANLAAGQPIFQATQQWTNGNEAFADGNYEQAFDDYRKAYQSAVKSPGE